jgi:hypothetical protein
VKLKNEHLKQLTEIKQYFLDPPHSFKLYSYAIPKAEEAMQIVQLYTKLQPMYLSMDEMLMQMKEMQSQPAQLRKTMIEFGRLFTYLNR